MGTLLMGIDVGTYSSKGVLCTAQGGILAEQQLEHRLSVPQAGWAEQDADQTWYADICSISKSLLIKASRTGKDVAVLAVSALGPDLVALDADFKPLRPAILYGIDTRATAEIAWLDEHFGSMEMAKQSGMLLTSSAIGPKILWLKNHEPGTFKKTRYLCSGSSYLVLRLTGEYILDRHSASHYNPLFDICTLEWSDTFAAPLEGNYQLPRLIWAQEMAGTLTDRAAREMGLQPGIPVTAGTVDSIAEAISIGAIHPGDLAVTFGTTTYFVQVMDKSSFNETMWHSAYFRPGLYLMEGGTSATGGMTRWFRDNFARKDMEAEQAGGENAYAGLTKEAAQVPPGSQGLIVLPYLSGERTPINDPMARGVIYGLTLAHVRGHIYRAVLEATAYAVAHNLEVLRAAGSMPQRIIGVGGMTRSPLFMQIVSDVTGVELLLPEKTIGACYGDCFLAGLAAGLFDLDDLEIRWVKPAASYQPNDDSHQKYQPVYRAYKELYLLSKDSMHRLAELDSGDTKTG
jgi:xylulokinase